MPTDFAPVSAPAAAAPLFAGAALLDAEKLDCYRLAVEFHDSARCGDGFAASTPSRAVASCLAQ